MDRLCFAGDDDLDASTKVTFRSIRIVEDGGSAADLAFELEMDVDRDWLMGSFRVSNDSATRRIVSVELDLSSGNLDYLNPTSAYSVLPDIGTSSSNNEGVTASVLTLNFGAGLAPGGSAGSSFDIDSAAPASIDARVVFDDGSAVSGTLIDVGDSDDADPLRYLWIHAGLSGSG